MRAERNRKTRKNEKGQSMVEFALVVPLLLFLVVGIFEFGRAWMTKNLVTGAAREAVRMYAVKDDTATARARADQILSSGGLDNTRAGFYPSQSDNTVSYRITYDFPTVIVGFIPGLDNITLSSTTTMRKEY